MIYFSIGRLRPTMGIGLGPNVPAPGPGVLGPLDMMWISLSPYTYTHTQKICEGKTLSFSMEPVLIIYNSTTSGKNKNKNKKLKSNTTLIP